MRAALLALCVVLLLAAAPPANAQLTTASASGTWTLTASGKALSPIVVLLQNGDELTGNFGTDGMLTGKINPDNVLQFDFRWSDSRGSGWGTMTFDASYTRFHGKWGMTGAAHSSGSFTAVRYTPPDPPIVGIWDVTVTGPAQANGRITVKKKGNLYIGSWKDGQATGVFANHDNTMYGSWQTLTQSGSFTLKFTPDGKSFSGTWGFVNQAQSGQVAGRKP